MINSDGRWRTTQFESRTYDEGRRAGIQARLRRQTLGPYQRVGLDAFARGFRAGYFAQPSSLQRGEAGEGRAAV